MNTLEEHFDNSMRYKAAMKYTEEQAIAFAEWVVTDGYIFWPKYDQWSDDSGRIFTTQQLYNLFLKSQEK